MYIWKIITDKTFRQAISNAIADNSIKQNIKLILKIFLSIFGIEKCLYIGVYRYDWRMKQDILCEKIYEEIMEKKSSNVDTASYNTLTHSGTYIAQLVDNLDCGGLEEVVKELCSELVKRGVKVKVLCKNFSGKLASELCDNYGVEIKVFNGNKKRFKEYLCEDKPILVHSHGTNFCYREIKQLGIPIIETIHNTYVYKDKKALREERKKTKYVNKYIAVSSKVKETFICKVSSDVDVGIIGNAGKSLEAYCVEENSNDGKFDLKLDGGIVFTNIGTIDVRKNQLGLIRAFEILQRVRDEKLYLLLAGAYNDDHYYRLCKSYIKERGIEENVIFLGFCPNVEKILSQTDFCCVNSYYEGWSMAATEALHYGIPLIHSDCGGAQELLFHGKNGILVANPLNDIEHVGYNDLIEKMSIGYSENIKDLVLAMSEAIDEKSYWESKNKQISEWASQQCSIDRNVELYINEYKGCVNV